jgi:hypothetical protein
VPPEDTERLYSMLRELREEVVGYRADLNGRLRALEAAEARRQGADYGKGSLARLVAGTAALAAAIAGVITATLNYV